MLGEVVAIVVRRLIRALGFVVLALLMLSDEIALAAPPNLIVGTIRMQLTPHSAPPRAPFAGFPSLAGAESYAAKWRSSLGADAGGPRRARRM